MDAAATALAAKFSFVVLRIRQIIEKKERKKNITKLPKHDTHRRVAGSHSFRSRSRALFSMCCCVWARTP